MTQGRWDCSLGAGGPGGSVVVGTSQASSSRLCGQAPGGHKDHCALLRTASGVLADGVQGYLHRCCPFCLMGAFQGSLSVLIVLIAHVPGPGLGVVSMGPPLSPPPSWPAGPRPVRATVCPQGGHGGSVPGWEPASWGRRPCWAPRVLFEMPSGGCLEPGAQSGELTVGPGWALCLEGHPRGPHSTWYGYPCVADGSVGACRRSMSAGRFSSPARSVL